MNTDICFVCSPVNWSADHPPYHYLYLGAHLEKEGISYEIIDEKCKHHLVNRSLLKITAKDMFAPESIVNKRIISRLKRLNPRAVGLAVYSSDYNYAIKFANLIKKEIGCPIIVGNAHATISPADFVYPGSSVDYVVVGEGEITLTELLKCLKKGSPVDNVRGIMYLKEGRPVFTGKRELLADLSINLEKAYKQVPMDYYTRPTMAIIRLLMIKGAGVWTGRGCPFSCTFCAANVIWASHSSKLCMRFRPLEDVINEIIFLRDTYQIDAFSVNDDTFTLAKERVYNFCEKLKAAKLNLIWTAQARVNLINKDMILAMKDAGCIQVEFGIESASPSCLKEIDKKINPEEQLKAFEICNATGLRTFANMLINIPGETKEDIQASERFLEKVRPSEVAFAITTPYPGTAIYEKYINPKLDKAEYDLLLAGRQSGNSRFRLCRHDYDLVNLRDALNKKYRFALFPYISFTSQSAYLNKLWGHKFKYLSAFVQFAIKYSLERAWFYLKRLRHA